MKKEYYILAVEKTRTHHEGLTLTWWRPECSGYTIYLESAGRYSAELVKEEADYYNNGKDTIAVRCDRAE